ncbi:DMT family transporter [Aneurinibacillus sp. UBA3580]|uniref:DMT family transporter n=1 Tax=Aneurinibacillus sp. UBA3580 TaxID=1946041 RepID=UPI0039C85DA6
MDRLSKYRVYLILFCTMIVWGFNVTAVKVLVTNFMPVTMTAFRIFAAGVSVFIILFCFKKVRMLTKTEFRYIFFGGLLNVVAHHYFLSVGLTKTSASNGGLILGMGPLLTAILAALFLGNRFSVMRVIGILLGITGVSFIVLKGNSGINGISMGDVNVFVSVFAQAISFILIRKASSTLDPRLMTGYMLVIGSVFLFILGLFLEPGGIKSMAHGSIGMWVIFFASAIIATAIGHMIYNQAIGNVGAAESAIFLNLSPFFSLVGAAIFLGERIVMEQILGFIFILFGVLLGSGAFEEMRSNIKQKRAINLTKPSWPIGHKPCRENERKHG